jgi:hypothetical protein
MWVTKRIHYKLEFVDREEEMSGRHVVAQIIACFVILAAGSAVAQVVSADPGDNAPVVSADPGDNAPVVSADPGEGTPEVVEEKQPDGSIVMPDVSPEPKQEVEQDEPSSSKAFGGSELLVGRFVKQPTGAKKFAVGLNIQFAPMNMVLGSQKDVFIDGTVAAACGDDAACEAAAEENMDAALGAIAEVPEDDWNALVNGVSSDQGLEQALAQAVASGAMTESDADSVQSFAGELPKDEAKAVLGATRLLAKQDATSVLVEPNMELNFSFMSVSLRIPMAMVIFEDETKWNFGNVTLDTKFGGSWGSSAAAFGIGAGLSLYLPTGTEEASSMALADLWFGPKFMHGYLTAAPYFAMGFDSYVISLQAHGELVSQHYVLGEQLEVTDSDQLPTNVLYGKYGAGVVVMPNWPLSLIAEINGLYPINDEASPYNAIFGIAGVQTKLLWLKAAVAGQFPIVAPEPEDLGAIGGVSLGELASYSIIARASFVF